MFGFGRRKKNNDEKIRNIEVQIDTLKGELHEAGGFEPERNTIKLNYSGDDQFGTDWANHYGTMIHELHHQDNAREGLYAYPVSAEQAYKLNMHDEISANLAELVATREKYLKTGDISVFDEKGGKFDFYKKAIEDGTIKVNSPVVSEHNAEMSFMVNEVRNMWERDYATSYVGQNAGVARDVYDKSGQYARYYDQNYNEQKKIPYDRNMGGIHFSEYIDREVEIPEEGRRAIETIKPENNNVNTSSNVTNEPINELPPEKPRWHAHHDIDGLRFSEPQERKVIDLRQDVIKKPDNFRSPSDHPEATRKVLIEPMREDGGQSPISRSGAETSEKTASLGGLEGLKAKMGSDHERLQGMREKLHQGHELAQSRLSANSQSSQKSAAEMIREKRFESTVKSRPVNTQQITRESMQRAMANQQSAGARG